MTTNTPLVPHLDRRVWHSRPQSAWLSFLHSPHYTEGSRSTRSPGVASGMGVAADSTRVYAAMFGKYLRHLQERGRNVLDADEHDLECFLHQALAGSARETHYRYRRLLERLHGFLHAKGLRHNDPFATWWAVQGRASAFAQPVLPAAASAVLPPDTLDRLHRWLLAQGEQSASAGDWKRLRNLTLAAVSVSSGLRSRELLLLRRSQVQLPVGGVEACRAAVTVELHIPLHATVRTSRAHVTRVNLPGDALFHLWWEHRWGPQRTGCARHIPGEWVFPATGRGQAMAASTAFRALQGVARAAEAAAIVTGESARQLHSGARGLRRQYALAELAQSTDDLLLQQRLGYHQPNSVQRLRQTGARRAP